MGDTFGIAGGVDDVERVFGYGEAISFRGLSSGRGRHVKGSASRQMAVEIHLLMKHTTDIDAVVNLTVK